MSSISTAEKQYFESLFGMRSGYVLSFTDESFAEHFNSHNVDIHGGEYQKHGTSKARKLRVFWEIEPDMLVGRVLAGLLDVYEADCNLEERELNPVALQKCRNIVGRLTGKSPDSLIEGEAGFLSEEFAVPDLHKLPVDSTVAEIVRSRLEEARTCLKVGAHLSVIFLCGSILEGVLLGAAEKSPKTFNQSASSPKDRNGKVKPFPDWSLSEFINVAHDVGVLKTDVQKFSHGLREFRNYIHPYQQMASKFNPDEHTAKVCFQVLKAALADVSGERK